MTETSTVADPSTSTRLPLAELPATVLPGAVITLALVTDQARRAVEAARGAGDSRVLLRSGDEPMGVVGDPAEHRFQALYGRGARLWGALGVNAPKLVMPYRRLLEDAVTWDDALAFSKTQQT